MNDQELTWETLSGTISAKRSTYCKKSHEGQRKRRKGAEWRHSCGKEDETQDTLAKEQQNPGQVGGQVVTGVEARGAKIL